MIIFEVKVKELMMMKIRYKKIMTFIVVLALIFSIGSVNNSFRTKAEENYGVTSPVKNSSGLITWDCIYFGHYWQNDTNGDGIADKKDDKEAIKWRVLNVKGNDAFIMAEKSLDCKKYNDSYARITWSDCTLRSWLNGYGASYNLSNKDYSSDNFIDEAFSDTEKKAILKTEVVNDNSVLTDRYNGPNTFDQIYLLSISDINNKDYGFNSGSRVENAKNTAFAKVVGAYTKSDTNADIDGNGYWWLRSAGRMDCTASYVNYDGWNDNYCNIDYVDVAVRPVLHVDLSQKKLWTYAGQIKSNGETTGNLPEVTKTPVKPTTNPTGKVVPEINGKTSYKKYLGNGRFNLNITSESNGNITYKSSNNKIVKVSNSGTVSIVGCGSAVVTIHLEETSSYYEATKTVNISVYPARVTSFKAKNKKGTLVCTWKKQNIKNAKCQIQAAYTSNFKKSYSLKTKPALNKGKVNANGLSTKKNYYVRIRAFIKIDGKEYDGQWSKAVKVKVK